MTEISTEEQCIALTTSGERCKRVAKDRRFCFQHDEENEVVVTPKEEDSYIINWLSGGLGDQAARASGIKRDVYLNIADAQEGIQDTLRDIRNGNSSLPSVFSQFYTTVDDVAGERGTKTVAGAVVGGIVGILGGPAGIYTGIVAGSTIGFYLSEEDDRGIIGFHVSEVPDDAEIVDSTHPAIREVDPIQLVVQSTVEDADEDWVRETKTRAWDMNQVEEALSALPKYEADESPPGGYYVRDENTESVIVLVFGQPEEELLE